MKHARRVSLVHLTALAVAVTVLLPSPAFARQNGERPARKSTQRVQTRDATRPARDATTRRFKMDENGDAVPDVRAEAAIVFSPETGQVLWQDNAQDQRSIASITKVMTALVYLEDDPDLEDMITVTRRDLRRASTTFLRAGEKVSGRDLLHLALIASDNAAARILARTWHGGPEAFVDRMNEKAIELGLDSASFVEPSGLDSHNVSSAYDLSRLIVFAAGDERLASVMRKPEYGFRTSRRRVVIRNTNKLIGGEVDVLGGKTGFIRQAGYCLATLIRLPGGQQVAVVVLGARSNLGRFLETRHLFAWLTERAHDLITPGFDRVQ